MKLSREGIKLDKPLRVKVVTAAAQREYVNAGNKKMVVVEGVLADGSGYKKFSCYNRIAFPFIKPNNCLMLLNAISKTNEIVATGECKVIMIPEESVVVPKDVLDAAQEATFNLNSCPASHILKIEDILQEKEGKIFNVLGRVIEVNL